MKRIERYKDRMKKAMTFLLNDGPAAVRKWVLLVKEPDGVTQNKVRFISAELTFLVAHFQFAIWLVH